VSGGAPSHRIISITVDAHKSTAGHPPTQADDDHPADLGSIRASELVANRAS